MSLSFLTCLFDKCRLNIVIIADCCIINGRTLCHQGSRIVFTVCLFHFNVWGEKACLYLTIAIKENQNNPDHVALLEQAKRHFKYTQISIDENGRNSIMHGRIHTRL